MTDSTAKANSSYPKFIRAISLLLIASFSAGEMAHAAPSDATGVFGPNPASIRFSGAYAKIGDVYRASGRRMLIHIQDAHTNTGAEKNMARTIEELVTKYKIDTVFVEGGTRDDSFDFLRKRASRQAREKVAKKYLGLGELNGAEYLSLATDLDFKIWGVEDGQLYRKSLESYAGVAARRAEVLSYIDLLRQRVQSLKRRMYPKDALAFDDFLVKFRSKEKSFTEYHETLSAAAEKYGVNLLGFPNFLSLKELKKLEDGIDFEKANREQEVLARKLADENFAAHVEKLKSGAMSPLPFYETMVASALQKKVDLSAYPQFMSYVKYLRAWSTVKTDRFLKESQILEEAVFQRAITDEDAFYLYRLSEYLAALKNLFSLQASREEFDAYSQKQKDIRFSTPVILAFLNRKLYDLGNYADVVPTKTLIDENKNLIEDFYRTTEDRDDVFLKKSLEKMEKDDIQTAILITGGFHTQSLKDKMKEKNVSYAVITPAVTEETNFKRYEKILLSRAGLDAALTEEKGKVQSHVIPEAAAEFAPVVRLVTAELAIEEGARKPSRRSELENGGQGGPAAGVGPGLGEPVILQLPKRATASSDRKAGARLSDKSAVSGARLALQDAIVNLGTDLAAAKTQNSDGWHANSAAVFSSVEAFLASAEPEFAAIRHNDNPSESERVTLQQILIGIRDVLTLPQMSMNADASFDVVRRDALVHRTETLWKELGTWQEDFRVRAATQAVIDAGLATDVKKNMATRHVVFEDGAVRVDDLTDAYQSYTPAAEVWAPWLTKPILVELVEKMPLNLDAAEDIALPAQMGSVGGVAIDVQKIVDLVPTTVTDPLKRMEAFFKMANNVRNSLDERDKIAGQLGLPVPTTLDETSVLKEQLLRVIDFLVYYESWKSKKARVLGTQKDWYREIKTKLGIDDAHMSLETFIVRLLMLNFPKTVVQDVADDRMLSVDAFSAVPDDALEKGMVAEIMAAGGIASRFKTSLGGYVSRHFLAPGAIGDGPRSLEVRWEGNNTGVDLAIEHALYMGGKGSHIAMPYILSPFTWRDMMHTVWSRLDGKAGRPNVSVIIQNSGSGVLIKGGTLSQDYVADRVLGHGNIRDFLPATIDLLREGVVFGVVHAADNPLSRPGSQKVKDIIRRMRAESIAHMAVGQARKIGQAGGGFTVQKGHPNVVDTAISSKEINGYSAQRDMALFSLFINVINFAALLYAVDGPITWDEVQAVSKGDAAAIAVVKARLSSLKPEELLHLTDRFMSLMPTEFVSKSEGGNEIVQWEQVSGMLHGSMHKAITDRMKRETIYTDALASKLSVAYEDISMDNYLALGGTATQHQKPLFMEVKAAGDAIEKNPAATVVASQRTGADKLYGARLSAGRKTENAALFGFDAAKVDDLTRKNSETKYGVAVIAGHPFTGLVGDTINAWQAEVLSLTGGKVRLNAEHTHATVGAMLRSQDTPVTGADLSRVDFDKTLKAIETAGAYRIDFKSVAFGDARDGNIVLVGEVTDAAHLNDLQKQFKDAGFDLKWSPEFAGQARKVYVTLAHVGSKALDEMTEAEARALKAWVESHAALAPMSVEVRDVKLTAYASRTLDVTAAPDRTFVLGEPSGTTAGAFKRSIEDSFRSKAGAKLAVPVSHATITSGARLAKGWDTVLGNADNALKAAVDAQIAGVRTAIGTENFVEALEGIDTLLENRIFLGGPQQESLNQVKHRIFSHTMRLTFAREQFAALQRLLSENVSADEAPAMAARRTEIFGRAAAYLNKEREYGAFFTVLKQLDEQGLVAPVKREEYQRLLLNLGLFVRKQLETTVQYKIGEHRSSQVGQMVADRVKGGTQDRMELPDNLVNPPPAGTGRIYAYAEDLRFFPADMRAPSLHIVGENVIPARQEEADKAFAKENLFVVAEVAEGGLSMRAGIFTNAGVFVGDLGFIQLGDLRHAQVEQKIENDFKGGELTIVESDFTRALVDGVLSDSTRRADVDLGKLSRVRSTLTPRWDRRTGKVLSPYSPDGLGVASHGDLTLNAVLLGHFGNLLARAKELGIPAENIYVSPHNMNVPNSRPSAKMLATFDRVRREAKAAGRKAPIAAFQLVPNAGDEGGLLAEINGQLQIAEGFLLSPAKKADVKEQKRQYPGFNTNYGALALADAMDALFSGTDVKPEDLTVAALFARENPTFDKVLAAINGKTRLIPNAQAFLRADLSTTIPTYEEAKGDVAQVSTMHNFWSLFTGGKYAPAIYVMQPRGVEPESHEMPDDSSQGRTTLGRTYFAEYKTPEQEHFVVAIGQKYNERGWLRLRGHRGGKETLGVEGITSQVLQRFNRITRKKNQPVNLQNVLVVIEGANGARREIRLQDGGSTDAGMNYSLANFLLQNLPFYRYDGANVQFDYDVNTLRINLHVDGEVTAGARLSSLDELVSRLLFDASAMRASAENFGRHMDAGLAGQPSSLKMLDSYLERGGSIPDGKYLSIDLGGTNFRVWVVELKDGQIVGTRSYKETIPAELIRGDRATSDAFFGFIAEGVKRAIDQEGIAPGANVSLGFAFAFPVKQTAIDRGTLVEWVKGFDVKGVVGQDVVELLNRALRSKSISNVRVTALANDTVATMTAVIGSGIGAILGTGTNGAYWNGDRAVNTEWGAFNDFAAGVVTDYDRKLDAESENPGKQILEKMVSGKYLGELARLILAQEPELAFLKGQAKLEKGALQTDDLTAMVDDRTSSLDATAVRFPGLSIEQRRLVRTVATGVLARSARVFVIAASGIVRKVDPKLEQNHVVAVDGSLFTKSESYREFVRGANYELWGARENRIEYRAADDATGIGAAVIGAIAGARLSTVPAVDVNAAFRPDDVYAQLGLKAVRTTARLIQGPASTDVNALFAEPRTSAAYYATVAQAVAAYPHKGAGDNGKAADGNAVAATDKVIREYVLAEFKAGRRTAVIVFGDEGAKDMSASLGIGDVYSVDDAGQVVLRKFADAAQGRTLENALASLREFVTANRGKFTFQFYAGDGVEGTSILVNREKNAGATSIASFLDIDVDWFLSDRGYLSSDALRIHLVAGDFDASELHEVNAYSLPSEVVEALARTRNVSTGDIRSKYAFFALRRRQADLGEQPKEKDLAEHHPNDVVFNDVEHTAPFAEVRKAPDGNALPAMFAASGIIHLIERDRIGGPEAFTIFAVAKNHGRTLLADLVSNKNTENKGPQRVDTDNQPGTYAEKLARIRAINQTLKAAEADVVRPYGMIDEAGRLKDVIQTTGAVSVSIITTLPAATYGGDMEQRFTGIAQDDASLTVKTYLSLPGGVDLELETRLEPVDASVTVPQLVGGVIKDFRKGAAAPAEKKDAARLASTFVERQPRAPFIFGRSDRGNSFNATDAAVQIAGANSSRFSSTPTRYGVLAAATIAVAPEVVDFTFTSLDGVVTAEVGGAAAKTTFTITAQQFQRVVSGRGFNPAESEAFAARAKADSLLASRVPVWNPQTSVSVWDNLSAQITQSSGLSEIGVFLPIGVLENIVDFGKTVKMVNQLAESKGLKITIHIVTPDGLMPAGVQSVIDRIDSGTSRRLAVKIEPFKAEATLAASAIGTFDSQKLLTGAARIILVAEGSTADEIKAQVGTVDAAYRKSVFTSAVQKPEGPQADIAYVSFANIFVASLYNALGLTDRIPAVGIFGFTQQFIEGVGLVFLFKINLEKDLRGAKMAKQAEIAA